MAESNSKTQTVVPMLHRLLQDRAARLGISFDMIGSSDSFLELEKKLRDAATWNKEPVLLTGERGSGKEVAARALHLLSDRHKHPFLPVLVPALCEDLLADELFGHQRYAFTGALSGRLGRFAAAGSGTVFLDEIGDLSAPAQAALLRILETGEFTTIGEDLPRFLGVRILAASNQNLPQLVAAGRFRADLYDRLSVFEIRVPPLRERREDIPALASHFLGECCSQLGCAFGVADSASCRKEPIHPCASGEFYEGLRAHDWPGNVRELRTHIIRMRAAHPHEVLNASHAIMRIEEKPTSQHLQEPIEDADLTLETAMRRHITTVLDLSKHNLAETARKLGIPRTTLRDKIKKFAIKI